MLEHIAVVLQTRQEHEELNLREGHDSDTNGGRDSGIEDTDSSDGEDDSV